MQLSNRQMALITKLLTLEQAVTTQTLAETVHVSVRTVKNDLRAIQDWLTDYGDYYRSKPRVGVWLAANAEEKAVLKRQLFTNQSGAQPCTSQERVEQIVLLLTINAGFMTTQQLENKIDISKNTVIADLDKVEHFLKPFQLSLERKNYYGYRIAGTELNIRSVLEAVLSRTLHTFEAPILTSADPLKDVRQIQFQTVPELQTVLGVVITELENQHYAEHADFDLEDVLTMVVRMTIGVVRLSMNHPISSYTPLSVTAEEQQKLPYLLFDQVVRHYDFPALADEYAYLLRGVNPRFDDQNIAGLTNQVIQMVSRQLDYPFDTDSQLKVNLFSHLLTKLSNKYKFTNEYNPFVTDLKQRNLPLFEAVQTALRDRISANPAVVSESFIAFVTLHFMVSLESHQTTQYARVLYVCSTGLGVTGLIKREIERHVSNIEIAGFASVTTVEHQVAALKPDLLISIFPITETALPVVQVNPLPSSGDVERIRAAVAKVLKVSATSLTPLRLAPAKATSEDQVHTLMLNGAVIYSTLRQYFGRRIPAGYQEAFMIHVMMAVQRIYFHHSYDPATVRGLKAQDTVEDVQTIKRVFLDNQLTINAPEISALLQYTRVQELSQKGG
ncbi:BglG family transcription antiterminator [Lactiplantibacillus garii]|uniref:BglG family transcription antiterminator n=1 Tax=Lactiplantibacillus garii TaxID=2306423 RepID=UPI00131513E3|nr:transcription antiterminator [Lactiplantibacillus garii]